MRNIISYMGSFICVFSLIILTCVPELVSAQKNAYRIRTIAFYNTENLFDCINDTLTFDEDRTPDGKYKWTMDKYRDKISKIAYVLAEIGSEFRSAAPDIIGLCEIENKRVLNDLTNHALLRPYRYSYIHFDAPDQRGIDVALLYRQGVFIPDSFAGIPLLLEDDDGNRVYTRDQLLVSGRLDGETFHFIVNHWPSRRGGTVASAPKRKEAARLNKKIIDSILQLNPESKIISMGDFNDDPVDESFKKVLKTSAIRSDTTSILYNPMELLYKNGIGSLAHNDKWNLFDQFYFTVPLLSEDRTYYTFWKTGIFNKPYLTTTEGKYKGYPFRSYANGNYSGGYSDHYPIYMFLIKKAP